MLSKLRDPVSGLTHLGGAVLAAVGMVFLLVFGWGDVGRVISLTIYGVSLILMFSASATYHMTRAGQRVIEILRKIDHSAIYLLIAGTYTPFCLNALTGFWRWGLLAVIWTLAIGGIGVKIFVINAPRWVTAGVYVLMGWLCVFAVPEMLKVLPPASLIWLVVGGVAFTLGAVVYISKIMDFVPGIFGFHETWHIFVLLGAAAHYISLLMLVLMQ